MFIDFSRLYECVIEHGSIGSREETRTDSEDELCDEKSPESSCQGVDTHSEDPETGSEDHRLLASEDIRKIPSRDLEKDHCDGKNRLDHENILHRETVFSIEQRDDRHRHEEISDGTMEIEFPDI